MAKLKNILQTSQVPNTHSANDASKSSSVSGFDRVVQLSNAGMRKLVVYLGGVGLFLYGLLRLAPATQKLFPGSPAWVVLPVAASPLLVVALFDLLPSAIAAYKASRLRALGVSVTQDVSNYFRISPYEDTPHDRQAFRRADDAHTRVRTWIQSTNEPVLYLTGRSGTGKTSLMNASVVPTLSESTDFFPISLRASGETIIRLRRRLLTPEIIWKDPVVDPAESTETLLLRAATKLRKKIVLLLDQFEELLIDSANSSEVNSVKHFIESMASARDPRLLIVISIRDDYLGLLESLDLPRLTQYENWWIVSAFTEQASRDFLAGSQLILGSGLLETVTSQARAIEDVQGLIRPVTLNMIGLVLSVEANANAREAISRRGLQRMILGYINDTLNRNEIKPFAGRIIRNMYTREGLKKPVSVEGLATNTKLLPEVITQTLILVSSRGLVQRIGSSGSVWQISHDFVAKLFRDSISTWRLQVIRLSIAIAPPLLLATWLFILLFVLPRVQTQRLEDLVTKTTGGTAQVDNGQLTLSVSADARNLREIVNALKGNTTLVSLDLSQTSVTDEMLKTISRIPSLRILDLNDTSIDDEGLKYIAQSVHLRVLRLRSTKISNKSLSLLSGLGELEELVLGGTNISDEGFITISGIRSLRKVYLNYTGVSANGISGLKNARMLDTLEMNSTAASDSGIENIANLKDLQSLALGGTEVTSGGACKLQALSKLTVLDLGEDHLDSSVAACLAKMKQLTDVDLSHSQLDDDGLRKLSTLPNLENLELKETLITDKGLTYLLSVKNLKSLSVPGTGVTDEGMSTLAHSMRLRELYIGGTSVSNQGVKALTQLPDLRVLYLIGCKRVTDDSLPSLFSMRALQTVDLESSGMSAQAVDSFIRGRAGVQVQR